MTDQGNVEPNQLTESFAAHMRAFHATLPPEEQALLEQIFRLAEAAVGDGDVSGYAFDAFLKITGGPADSRVLIGLLMPAVMPVSAPPQIKL